MSLIVQKYGGTSVGTIERIQAVADRINQTVKAGNSVVVIVSAMGKTTDELLKLAKSISATPDRRELDMLLSTGEQVSIALVSMALQELGQPAISLNGVQVGIVTEPHHTRARILQIETQRIERHLTDGKVVVIAGFQGMSSLQELEITTLGRGGSDTSAVAIAAALRADICEIYTDVPGILTTDPRLVPNARLMDEITCDEMLELASLGAKVLHPRAVEIARNYGVPLVVRSSWTDEPGTKVISLPNPVRSLIGLEITRGVDAVELDLDQAKVALLRVPDCPGVAAKLFGEIANQDLDVDLIIQSIHEFNTNDIAFTVTKNAINRAVAVSEAIAPVFRTNSSPISNQAEVILDTNIAKISISGAGMIGRPGVAAQMFATLAEVGVNIQMISTSEIKVSCVIEPDQSELAIATLLKTFDIPRVSQVQPTKIGSSNKPVRGVALDKNQARLAIRQIPDRPGMAAKLFGALAQANISVDMIIQSQRCRIINNNPTRDIAFTVALSDAVDAVKVLEPVIQDLDSSEITLDDKIAKVSIVGTGMQGHPGVAAILFQALAQANINIQMIATSEIKISCVVDSDSGETALRVIHDAFQLSQI